MKPRVFYSSFMPSSLSIDPLGKSVPAGSGYLGRLPIPPFADFELRKFLGLFTVAPAAIDLLILLCDRCFSIPS